jgi:8-oxo-dGTP diphosphatase
MDDFLLKLYRHVPMPTWLVKKAIWVFSPKYCIGVIGIIFNDDHEILLVNHTYRGKYSWALPSGIGKKGEDPKKAIVREIEEEIGLNVVVKKVLDISLPPGAIYLDIFLLCEELETDTLRLSLEISEVSYFNSVTLPRENISPDHLVALEQILDLYSQEDIRQ